MYTKIKNCRISSDKNLINLFSKKIVLTGEFPKKKINIRKTPLSIVFSKKSGLLQLNHNYNQNVIFSNNYGYRSGLNKSMSKHLFQKANKISRFVKLKNNDLILDIGSNDGTFLNFFNDKLIKHGVDPTSKKFSKFYNKKIKKHSVIFSKKIFHNKYTEKFKLISCIAMFYDLKDPVNFCKIIYKLLRDDGIFHIEIAYLPDIIKKKTFDTFCQEHLTYFSLNSFLYMMKKTQFKIVDLGFNDINGGSIWLNLAKNGSQFFKENKSKIQNVLKIEEKKKILEISTYKKFFYDIKNNIKKISKLVKKIKKNKNKIIGFGASTKGNVILQFCNIDHKYIDYILDVNPEKFNCYTPGTKIIIVNEDKLEKSSAQYVLLLIWHFKKSIKEKLRKFIFKGGKLILPFPKLKIIDKYNFYNY